MGRLMLKAKGISKRFWAEALNTACHLANGIYLRLGCTMTPYEIIFGVFGCIYYVLNDRDLIFKFNSKSDKDYF